MTDARRAIDRSVGPARRHVRRIPVAALARTRTAIDWGPRARARDARRVRDGASRGTVNGGTYYVLQYRDGVERKHTKSRRRAHRASSTHRGGGWTRPLGHRSHDRIPPVVSRRRRTNERRSTRTNAVQKKNSTYPPRASSVLRLARARIARASTPLAPAALVPAGAAGGGVRARAPTGGARAASGALIARHDARKKRKNSVHSFVRSRVVSRARECGDAPPTQI